MPTTNPLAGTVLATRLIGLQLFKEAAWGTPAAATAKLMGVQPLPTFTPMIKSTLFDEQRGAVTPAFNSAILQKGGKFEFNMHVTYEDVLYLLAAAVQGGVVPTGSGTYTWAFAAPVTPYIPWPAQTYTFEYGYDIGAVQAAGCVIEKLTFKGASNKQLEASVSGWYKSHTMYTPINIQSSTSASPIVVTTSTTHNIPTGAQVVISGHLVNTNANGVWTVNPSSGTTMSLVGSQGNGTGAATGTVVQTITPAIADRSAEIVIVPGTALSIDAAGGTIGTTPIANVLSSFELSIETGLKPVYTDQLVPTGFTYEKYNAELTLKLIYNATVKSMLQTGAFSGAGNLFRLAFTGSSPRTMNLDFAGVLSDDPKQYESQEGAMSIPLKFSAKYDTGAFASFLKSQVINQVASLA